VDGGGSSLEDKGYRRLAHGGYQEERAKVKGRVAARSAERRPPAAVIFVDTSQDFAPGHVPGARWVPRG
jgi:hypothetical protein